MGIAGIDGALEQMKAQAMKMEEGLAGLDAAISGMKSALDGFDGALASPMLSAAQRTQIEAQRDGVQEAFDKATADLEGFAAGKAGIEGAVAKLSEVHATLIALVDELPGAFATARTNYISSLEAKRTDFEKTFQDSLGTGFRNMYLLVAVSTVLAFLVLLFYRSRKKDAKPV